MTRKGFAFDRADGVGDLLHRALELQTSRFWERREIRHEAHRMAEQSPSSSMPTR